jgi:hypothetical protein
MSVSRLYLVIKRLEGGGETLRDKENELLFFQTYYLMKNGLDAQNFLIA